MSIDIHALSGAYAVDALDDIERASFERHLAECADCRAEVDSLREAAALLPATAELAPRAELRDAVLAGITTVRPLPPVVTVVERGRATRRRFPALVAAAVALIAIGGAGTTVWHPWSDDTVQGELSASERVIQAPDREKVVHELEGGGTATVYRSKILNQAVVVTDAMPDAPSGHAYELWLQQGAEMIAAGQMAGGASTVLLDGDAASARGVGITVEVAGSDPVDPTFPAVAVIGFEQA